MALGVEESPRLFVDFFYFVESDARTIFFIQVRLFSIIERI